MVFDIAFAPRDVAADAEVCAAVFADPVAFEPRRLAKLALATEASRTALAVDATAEGLRVWGLVHGPRTWPGFVLQVRAPGMLRVLVGSRTLFRYARGRGVVTTEDGPSEVALAKTVAPFTSVAVVRGIARAIVTRSNGGSLFFLPEDVAADDPRFDEVRFPIRGRAAELLCPRADGHAPEEDALAFVARLTAIDGAVLLGPGLRVSAFGAFVKSPGAARPPRLIDAAGQTQPVSTLKGARHKSALWLCQSFPSALAMVVSHEGELSLYARSPANDGAVLVERDVDL